MSIKEDLKVYWGKVQKPQLYCIIFVIIASLIGIPILLAHFFNSFVTKILEVAGIGLLTFFGSILVLAYRDNQHYTWDRIFYNGYQFFIGILSTALLGIWLLNYNASMFALMPSLTIITYYVSFMALVWFSTSTAFRIDRYLSFPYAMLWGSLIYPNPMSSTLSLIGLTYIGVYLIFAILNMNVGVTTVTKQIRKTALWLIGLISETTDNIIKDPIPMIGKESKDATKKKRIITYIILIGMIIYDWFAYNWCVYIFNNWSHWWSFYLPFKVYTIIVWATILFVDLGFMYVLALYYKRKNK